MRHKTITQAKLKELRFIKNLQKMNCYDGLVKRLAEGFPSTDVARWAMSLNIEGSPGKWSYWYWRDQITALAKQVRVAKRKARTIAPPRVEAIIEKVGIQVTELQCLDVVPDGIKGIWIRTEKSLREVRAEQMLKANYFLQLERVERIIATEKRVGMALSNTHNEIHRLNELAIAVGKLEMSEQFLRGKLGNGPYLPPVSEIKPGDLAHLEEGMQQFDEIDRNLIRQATRNVIQMVREDVSGRFEAVGLEADAEGTPRTSAASDGGSASTDVAEGA